MIATLPPAALGVADGAGVCANAGTVASSKDRTERKCTKISWYRTGCMSRAKILIISLRQCRSGTFRVLRNPAIPPARLVQLVHNRQGHFVRLPVAGATMVLMSLPPEITFADFRQLVEMLQTTIAGMSEL